MHDGKNSMRASAHWLHEVQRWCCRREAVLCACVLPVFDDVRSKDLWCLAYRQHLRYCGRDQWKRHGAPIRTQLANARLVKSRARFSSVSSCSLLDEAHMHMQRKGSCANFLQWNINSIFLVAQLCLDLMFWWGTLPSGNTTWWPRDLVSFLKSDHHPSCLLSLWHSPFCGICIYINLSSLLSRGCSVRSGICIFHADGPSAPGLKKSTLYAFVQMEVSGNPPRLCA